MLAFIFESVGFGEWFLLLAVILIVVGPKRLPHIARRFGQYYSKFQRMTETFKRQLLEIEMDIDRAEKDVSRAAEDAFKIEGDEATAMPNEQYAAPEFLAVKKRIDAEEQAKAESEKSVANGD